MFHNPLLQACFLFDPRDPQGRLWRRHMKAAVLAFVSTYLVLHWMGGANAQGFDTILGVAQTQSEGWLSDLASKGQSVFLALAGLEITWCALLWAFEKDNMASIVGDLAKSVMTIAFFYGVMINAHIWIPAIHEQFTSSADTIGTGLTVNGVIAKGLEAALFVQLNLINPAIIFAGIITQFIELFQQGVQLMAAAVALPGGNADAAQSLGAPLVEIGMTLLWGFSSWMIGGLVSICVLICYLIIALQLIMLKVEMFVLMGAGAVFLGLGGSKWTRDYVQKYMNHALVTGFRYLVLMMVLSFTMAGADAAPWDATANAFMALKPGNAELRAQQSVMMSSFGILFLVLVKMLLATKAPDLAGALFSGGASLTAGAVSGAVMGAANTAMMAAGAPASIAGAAEAMGKLSAGGLKGAFDSGAMGAVENKAKMSAVGLDGAAQGAANTAREALKTPEEKSKGEGKGEDKG